MSATWTGSSPPDATTKESNRQRRRRRRADDLLNEEANRAEARGMLGSRGPGGSARGAADDSASDASRHAAESMACYVRTCNHKADRYIPWLKPELWLKTCPSHRLPAHSAPCEICRGRNINTRPRVALSKFTRPGHAHRPSIRACPICVEAFEDVMERSGYFHDLTNGDGSVVALAPLSPADTSQGTADAGTSDDEDVSPAEGEGESGPSVPWELPPEISDQVESMANGGSDPSNKSFKNQLTLWCRPGPRGRLLIDAVRPDGADRVNPRVAELEEYVRQVASWYTDGMVDEERREFLLSVFFCEETANMTEALLLVARSLPAQRAWILALLRKWRAYYAAPAPAVPAL